MADIEERLNRQAIRREYVQSQLWERRFSVIGQLWETIIGTVALLFFLGLLIAGLDWIGLISDRHFPATIRYAEPASLTAILYLMGPLVALLSIWVYHRVNKLERAIRHRILVASDLDYRKGWQVDEVIELEKKERELSDKVENWDEKDPDYQAYSKVSSDLYRKKEALIGFNWWSLIALIALVAINWITIGSQFYYGVQWAFVTKWISIPVLIVWILATLLFTIAPAIDRDVPKPM
jgi:ABC-type multidrug transport system fused ATPase/permease subunit